MLTTLLALLALAQEPAPPQLVDTVLLTDVSHTPHATLFVAPELVAAPREESRLALREPGSAEVLYTETHEVLRGSQGSVVLVVGYSEEPIGGTLEIVEAAGGARRGLSLFSPAVATLDELALVVDGKRESLVGAWIVERPSAILLRIARHIPDVAESGIGAHLWVEVAAGPAPRVRMIVQLHNALVPSRPDAYFREVSLELPDGWSWSGELPDPAHGDGKLVNGSAWLTPAEGSQEIPFEVLTRTRARELRLVLELEEGARQGEGWGVTTWRRGDAGLLAGGYGPTGIAMPERTDEVATLARAEVGRRWALASESLAAASPDPHEGLMANADRPPSPFWVCRGVRYGGMTGGIDIDAHVGVLEALAARREGLLLLRTEALRYHSRQGGHVYQEDGEPVTFETPIGAGGRLPSGFAGNRWVSSVSATGADPWGVRAAEQGDEQDGLCRWEAELAIDRPFSGGWWEALDGQHGIRDIGAQEALLVLDDDPLAALHIRSQATLWAWETYGRFGPPRLGPHVGSDAGRAEAWTARTISLALGLARVGGRTEEADLWQGWLGTFVDHLRASQRPCGLIMRRDDGKVATAPPMGHKASEPCPLGIHQPIVGATGEVADLCAGRPGEDVFLCEALLAAQWMAGIDCRDVRRGIAEGIRDYAWAFKPNGVALAGWGDRVAVAPALETGGFGPPFATQGDIPEHARFPPYGDGYDVPVVVAIGALDGVPMGLAFARWTARTSWPAARAYVLGSGGSLAATIRQLEQRALLLAVCQSIP